MKAPLPAQRDWARGLAFVGGLALMFATNAAATATPSGIVRVVALLTSGALLGGALAMCLPLHGGARVASVAPLALFGAYGFVWLLFMATGLPPAARSAAFEQVPLSGILLALAVLLLAYGTRLDDERTHRSARAAAFVIAACGGVPVAFVLSSGAALDWLPDTARVWVVGTISLLAAAWLVALFDTASIAAGVRRVIAAVNDLRPRTFALLAATMAFALAVFVAIWCFSLRPRSSDEMAQLWHAKILLSGRLSLPVDPNPEFFAIDNVVDRERWYSQFPVGGPLLLAIGTALRLAWLLNPVLLALAVVHLYLFARTAYGETFARWTTLLFVLAPFPLLMSGTYMNHVPALWLTTVALHAYARWSTSDEPHVIRRSAAFLGASVAGLSTIRPYDALVLALVIGVAQLRWISFNRNRRRSLLVQLVAGVPFVLFIFWANWRTTGNPLRFGYDVMYGAGHSPGFHLDPYGQPFTPLRGLIYATSYLFQLNLLLFEWPVPALAFVVSTLLLLRRSDALRRWDMLLVSLMLAQIVAYGMYWHNGEFLGPRFLFSITPAVVLLAARAPSLAAERWSGRARTFWLALLPLATLGAWLPLPISTGVVARMRYYRAMQRHYTPDPVALVNADTASRMLVFVDVGITQHTARRLWALGVPRPTATTLVSRGNACSLIPAIDAEEAANAQRADTAGRVTRLLRAAARSTTDSTESRACQARIARERGAGMDYGSFLLQNQIGAGGRLDGRIIYAADLGDRDQILLQRFKDRSPRWLTVGPGGTALLRQAK